MERMMCQVCGRQLVSKADGTSRNHTWRAGSGDYCQGSGFRLARWIPGQLLRHHSGSVWQVIADLGGPYGDYKLRCIVGTPEWAGGAKKGDSLRPHGEYMHRHGWSPIDMENAT